MYKLRNAPVSQRSNTHNCHNRTRFNYLLHPQENAENNIVGLIFQNEKK